MWKALELLLVLLVIMGLVIFAFVAGPMLGDYAKATYMVSMAIIVKLAAKRSP